MRSGDHLPRGGLRRMYTHALVSVADEDAEETEMRGQLVTGVAWCAKGRKCIPFCRTSFLCVSGLFCTGITFVCSAVLLACLYTSSLFLDCDLVVFNWQIREDMHMAGVWGIFSLTICGPQPRPHH